ncbi:MAG: 3-dehydroquinate synthase [SAR202 cluster bacterium Io17-Chloro-G2]|nr:MAG: 3-dehydroquinate synthase [SAR202 cluster bacterium Io17-Chloro-G2]
MNNPAKDNRNIFLVGFMATGKTQVGRLLAQRIAWPMVDADDEIESRAGKSIKDIFQKDGEEAFRALEREALRELCAGTGRVVAAGGGAFIDPENRELMLANGLVICLNARPETIHRRVSGPDDGSGGQDRPVRPLLAGGDPLERINTLMVQRADAYSRAHHTVQTDELTIEQVAQRTLDICLLETRDTGGAFMADPNLADPDLAAVVHHSGGSYPVVAGWGIMDRLGERLQGMGVKSPAYIITDSNVMNPYGRRVQRALEKSGISAHCFVVPAGETSKSFQLAQAIYDWLVGLKAERGQAIIAVGGGVPGDLGGFVAATYLRGVPFIQVPTSMAAMADASIGGKTAVNLPQAKNMVGAFYQPQGVFADVQVLSTLGKRELAEGWAEAIKEGFILDANLVDVFEEHAEDLMRLEPEISTQVIRRSMAIKADVVSQDERETLGVRILLNYGHTIGHALEASTEYGRFMHGEGVAVGMMGAARIACGMGMISQEIVDQQERLLKRFSLPTTASGVSVDGIFQAMSLDKKTVGGSNRWVLLEEVGKAVVRRDVPRDLVEETVRDLVK